MPQAHEDGGDRPACPDPPLRVEHPVVVEDNLGFACGVPACLYRSSSVTF